MGTTLSMGYYQPANPDTGDIFYPALSANWALVNNHTHDGVTSQLLSLTSQSILSANWASVAGKTGIYSQTVVVPTSPAFNYDTCVITFKLSSGEVVYPSITRLSTTQYTIVTNDNTKTYTAYYR